MNRARRAHDPIDTEGANKLTQVTANTVKQLDSVLESFTGSSLSGLLGRYLQDRGNGSREEPTTP